MFNLQTLDMLIGLVTIYLAFAMACTAIVEAVSSYFKLRSQFLELAIAELLNGKSTDEKKFVDAFYAHPLIQTLSQGGDGRPSYIEPELVGKVVEAVLIADTAKDTAEEAVAALPDGHLKELLQLFTQEAKSGTNDFKQLVAQHFDATMDRASGWFRRRTQLVGIVAASVIVIFGNVDTIAITTALSTDPEAQAQLVQLANDQLKLAQSTETQMSQTQVVVTQASADKAAADKAAADKALKPNDNSAVIAQIKANTEAANEAFKRATSTLEASGLPLGWEKATLATPGAWFSKVVGLVLSIFAISLGAPFWFQVLQKLNVVRTSVASGKSNQQST